MAFTTGEVDVKLKNVSITNEKDVTIDDIVKEAAEINKKLRAENIKPGDYDASDNFMTKIRREHKEFSQSYPIVLRYMCQMQQFHAGALRKYLEYIRTHPWKNHDEYLDSQAQYVVILYKETHKRWNRTQVDNLRKNVRKLLQDEHDRFMELSEKYKKEVENEEVTFKNGRDETMREFYKNFGGDTSDLHLRIKTNVPTENLVPATTFSANAVQSNFSTTAEDLLG